MRIALIGPTHPYKGGIAHHTTELAHQLQQAGHEVSLISWSAQYPSLLYPGVQRVPDNKPEMSVFPGTTYPLSWKNPGSWLKVGRALRRYDKVIIVFVSSVQVPIYLSLLKAMGSRRNRGEVIALCHNVSVHEGRFFDAPLITRFLKAADRILVHTAAQATVAEVITNVPISVADMPPHLPAKAKGKHSATLQHHVLFFGMVRKYKGVDVLLKALAKTPGISLTIAGEIWGGAAGGGSGQEGLEQLIKQLSLQDRVTLRAGYVPSQDIPELFAEADALVLPYRSGTATQNVSLAYAHGIPVIATTVGSMAAQVNDGVDGLLCKPDNVTSLAEALRHFYEPGVAQKLSQHLPAVGGKDSWQTYIHVLLG